MEISSLPVEIQNKIFYFLQHPVAEIFESMIICSECKRRKQNYHKCKYCKVSFCVRCEDYEKILYACSKKDDELVCVKCLDGELFEHFHKLYYKNKARFHRGVFERILYSA